VGPKASSGVLIHRLRPRHVALEAQFCSNFSVFVPKVPVRRVVAPGPRHQSAQAQQPDIVQYEPGFDREGSQSVDSRLRVTNVRIGAAS